MKKIFTLFAVAMMAVGSQAQEKLLFESGATYTDEQELTTENTKLVLGKDIKKAAKWDNKAAGHGAFLQDFSQQVMVANDDGEKEEKPRIVYIAGGNNPKDDAENKGGGFNGSTETGKLPQSGTYYKFTSTLDGKLKAGVILNGEKEFFVIDGTDAVASEDEAFLVVTNATANLTHDNYTFTQDGEEGTVLAYTDEAPAEGNGLYDGGKGGVKTVEKTQGLVEFSVQANHTYYLFCTGSKLMFFGYIFTPGGTDGINIVKAAAQHAPVYNLAGQKVAAGFKGLTVKNGKKVVMK